MDVVGPPTPWPGAAACICIMPFTHMVQLVRAEDVNDLTLFNNREEEWVVVVVVVGSWTPSAADSAAVCRCLQWEMCTDGLCGL